VDIDSNAVEVTKLSLLLKCMEGETKDTIEAQSKLFHDRILPTLDNNIKSGNSLIDLDYYDSQLDFGEERKIKPFSWQKAFPEVFDRFVPMDRRQPFREQYAKVKKMQKETDELIDSYVLNEPEESYLRRVSGFDCVIGNPPYGASFGKDEISYFQANYKLQNYQLDSYLLFLEKSFAILKLTGLLGFIVPNTWLLNLKTAKIREFIFSSVSLENIVHYQNPVFAQAVVDTEIIIFSKQQPTEQHNIQINIVNKQNDITEHFIEQKKWIELKGSPVNIFDNVGNQSVKEKITKLPLLETLCKITQGAKPFQVGKGIPKQTRKIVSEKPFVSDIKKDASFRPLLRGSLMNRYQINWKDNYWIKFGDWLAEPRYSANYEANEKIIIRQTGDYLNATLDTEQFIVRDNLYTIVSKEENINLKYILGLINSNFLNWFYQNVINPEKGEALAQVKRGHIAQLPIAKANKQQEEQIIRLVAQLLQLNEELQTATLPEKVEQLEQRIKHSEDKINEFVYELYGLTEEEINIIEK
jgi:hypothetical protein